MARPKVNGGKTVDVALRLRLLAELVCDVVTVQSGGLTALCQHLKGRAVGAVARHQHLDGLVLADEGLERLVVAAVGGHVERRPPLPISDLDRFVPFFSENGC